ncbi:MAG: S-layer homology domain-containing protein, partial [Oscillospiraceae bacterium]|nr:S-layer homology domain-containing protein [Oscillospiraceae bacterium]
EAAEVTSGLGIFDGYTDGSFGPENVVTRAEMAVIICKLLNGSDVDPGNFTGISKFTDVPAWAEGYVNFCAASDIVVGVGEGKFNPSATVTTVEAATMLLKALGYFTEEDKLKEDWKTVVTGRATTMGLYGKLVLKADEGLTRDNVAELVFNTLFAQRVAYDDNRQLYVKNTGRDVVVTNGTQDYKNTLAENTFGMWVVDGLVTANSCTTDDLSETTNNAPRTNVVFDATAAQDYPAHAYQGGSSSEYPFEYTTGLDMIGHAARVYYRMERNAPVVFAIADRATKVAYITYNSNNAALAEAANAAGFRRNTINQINEDDYKVNYAWDVTYRSLFGTAKAVDLTGDKTIDPAKTLLVISNSSDSKVDYVIVLDQYLDTVKRVVTRNDVTEYDLTTVDGVDQNILHGQAAQGDYVVVTDIGKSGDMLNFEPAEKLSANITKITGKSDSTATVKSIVADGTTYVGSPVYDYRVGNSALDDTTDFEDIATIGEATLLLDFQGKCIGLAQPESTPNYAYAAQFGVWHTGGSLNTEFKLTVKLYFLDGTSGVYLVNTADSQNSNTFYKLKMGTTESAAESVRDRLNGGSGSGAGYVDPTKTYDTNICVDNGTLWLRGKNVIETSDTNGLGIYKVSVRADDTVVMTKLGSNGDGAGHDSSIIPATDETKLISGHSTFVKQNGSNLTYKNTDKVMYQNNKTVYFYVDGSYNTELSVGAKYGVSNAISITNNKDKDDNTRKESFEQILLKGDARTNGLAVEAVLIYGYDMGSSETLYFYRQNDYDIQSKDASSRAGERNYTITYHLYTADGEPYEATFDNNGKYYDMETAKNTVENKPTGFYAIGSTDLDGKWTSNDPDTVLYKKNGENKDKPGAEGATNVYVLNAEAYHDTYADNLYTLSEVVGGIIPSTAKVVSTVDGCDFDSVSEIARACDNGHLVRISYTYSTSDYKVKTVFITDFKRDAGNLGGDRNPGASLWSSYDASMDRILVFDDVTKNPRSTLAEQLSSAEKALTDAGFTIVDSRTAGMYNKDENTYSWTIEATRVVGNTTRRYFFTGDPAGGQIYGNWYTGAIYTTKVLVNGNLAGYYVPNNTNPAKITVRTVNANKTYDVKWNNSAVVGSVTADEKAVISYLLP